MPGFNTTGAPNTQDYVLGRGRILLAAIDSTTGLPTDAGFRDLGNTPEFTLTVNVEDRRHKNSRDCLAFTDARFIISQECAIGFNLDETANFNNLSDFLSGSTETYDNPHDTSWATHETAIVTSSLVSGRWYELRAPDGTRIYNLDATGVVYSLEEDPAGTPVTVPAADYEIDEQLGLVRFLPAASVAVAGSLIGFAMTTQATTPKDLDQVNALQRAAVEGILIFIQENANDCGQKFEFRFHKVSLTAEGDLSMIGDEESVMSFSGVAEVNSFITDPSQVLTVRTYDMVS